ncbi:luciferase family oxidoreductase group 1 [Paraburkholderia rhizosphaerae]|uniref:Luciferase-like monooxygenase n=2 Tax=Paraburkholderia rhizosphaerae TaxID=480658 RepID=A0A4R8LI85_9BURK|nr:luciferase family oxidoreductase group 1 [Paraburkholderia rhizosphaerae]
MRLRTSFPHLTRPFVGPPPTAYRPIAMIPFSVLDLSPITAGSTATHAFHNTLDLAQHAERWGYRRFWLAEHHNMTGIASAATSVVIGYVAGGTQTIRVGSGGVMLPNHAPLVIAEQFGTLASLYPGRIDLGLGRAPGTDQTTARALRRDLQGSADSFPDDVVELQRYFAEPVAGQRVRAVPGAGLNVPLWLLGSSLFSAQLAAALGLPFAFASHFAPDHMLTALKLYRAQFRPSAALERPYAMVGVNLFAADTNDAARRLFTSLQQQFINLRRGTPGQLQPPVERVEASEFELASVAHSLAYSVIGDRDTVREQLKSIIEQTGADELMLTAQIYDHAARLRSFEIARQVRDELSADNA